MKVRISAPVRLQAKTIDAWWRQNRPAARSLFAQEFAVARRLLARTPEIGSPYAHRQGVLIRRVLLRRTQNHVYYEIDRVAGVVMILAIWGTPRGEGPEL